jgi:uncharacterized coiled-coil protein SlyX
MSEKLRPCWFCGNKLYRYHDGEDSAVECTGCQIEARITAKEWNKAFCWTEIDRLNKFICEDGVKLEKLRDELVHLKAVMTNQEKIIELDSKIGWGGAGRESDRLKAENEKMRDALIEISHKGDYYSAEIAKEALKGGTE